MEKNYLRERRNCGKLSVSENIWCFLAHVVHDGVHEKAFRAFIFVFFSNSKSRVDKIDRAGEKSWLCFEK
jgi:hypothetical protein